jgi:polar amino acid transport system substrate-binding protein
MSRKSLTNAQLEHWRTIVNGMRADGSMRRIFEKYFKPELAAALVNF